MEKDLEPKIIFPKIYWVRLYILFNWWIKWHFSNYSIIDQNFSLKILILLNLLEMETADEYKIVAMIEENFQYLLKLNKILGKTRYVHNEEKFIQKS